MRVDDRAERARKTRVDGRAHRLAQAQLFADALEDQDVRVDRHADREHDARDAREGQRGVEGRHAREQDQHVQADGDVGDEPRHAVVDHHEQHDGGRARQHRQHAAADRVRTERRADRPLFENRDGRRQRAGAQDDRQIARLVHGELPGDHGAPARDSLVDPRGRVEVAVEDDGEMAPDVLLGHLTEDPRPDRVKLDRHLPVAGRVRIRRDLRPVQLGAGEQRLFLHDERRLALGLRLLVHAPLVQDLVALGELARQRLLRAHAVVDQLELQQRRLADEGLGALRILDTRQLDQDAVLALPSDRRLGHPELVDAVADRLDALPDREVRDGPCLALRHREREPRGGLVRALHLQGAELASGRERVVPPLRGRELHGELAALAGHARDADALALKGGLEVLGGALELVLDRLVDLDAEHEMDAALQIEAQIDALLRRVHVPERSQDSGNHDADPKPEVPRHLCRAGPLPPARSPSGRTRASPGRRPSGRPCAR